MPDYRVVFVCDGEAVEGTASTPDPMAVARNPMRVVQLGSPLIITSGALPAGQVGNSYSVVLSANGGLAPYIWTIVSGTLPAGLTLSGGGLLSGTPTEVADRPLVIGVADNASRHDTKSFTLSVDAGAVVDHGPRFNDWVLNKTSGDGGDYPTGDIGLLAGVYYVDPFDLSPTGGYVRAFDGAKPNGNWFRIFELDGPGTVKFDLRPESAASALGQSQTAAYNDTSHGGSFRAVAGTSGSVRWVFDGEFEFADGSVHSGGYTTGSDGFDRLFFHNTTHHFTITEWLRQYKIIAALRGVTDPGSSIPNDSPSFIGLGGNGSNPDGGAYWRVYNEDTRFKGNNQPTPFRLERASRLAVIRGNVGPAGDDCIFIGSGDHIDSIGTLVHEAGDTNVATIGAAANWFHPDVLQIVGPCSNSRLLDSTAQGHINIGAESEGGSMSNVVIDRVWQGVSQTVGGAVYAVGHSIDNTNKWGSGAPTTRLTGHYIKGFSNGTDHRDGGTQGTITIGANGWHFILIDYDNQPGYADINPSLGNFSVAVPSGVTVDSDGFITSSLSTFLNNANVPHKLFQAAYADTELDIVMADYGLAFD